MFTETLSSSLLLVLDDSYRSCRVLIENVTHYAYGQHDDGEVGLWVAGHAGWFSIKPARGYIPMFNEMVEAIDLLYFLTDKHQRKARRGRRWNPKPEYLFDEVQHISRTSFFLIVLLLLLSLSFGMNMCRCLTYFFSTHDIQI